jgi:flagellar biogenesis protein FliO
MVDGIAWWRWMLLALFFVALGFLWWRAKAGQLRLFISGKKDNQRLKILERRYLGPKTCIVLVELDGRHFLLAESGSAVAWQPISSVSADLTTTTNKTGIP